MCIRDRYTVGCAHIGFVQLINAGQWIAASRGVHDGLATVCCGADIFERTRRAEHLFNSETGQFTTICAH